MHNKNIPLISDVLLHDGNMRLLDRIVDFDTEFALAEYTPQASAWYADSNGNMPAWIGIELMAQAISAHAGLLKHGSNTPPKQGALLGTRSYLASIPTFAPNQPLMILVTLVYKDVSGLGAYDCMIYDQHYAPNPDNHLIHHNYLAKATLKVFEPDNFQQFLQEHS